MKKIKLSSALKRTVSFVLAIMILTSVFTVSGLVVSADSEEGNSASTESEKVDIYVKTADDVIPYIDINNTRSTVNGENGLYKFTLDKDAIYSLGYYKQLDDDNYVYFSYGNISEWEGENLYMYCWNDDFSNNAGFPGEIVNKENPENTIYYKSGNEYITMENTYRVQFDSKYGNIIFSTGSNECQTVDLKLQENAFYGLSGNIATADELSSAKKYDVIDHDAKAYEFFPFYQNKTANENSYIDFTDSTAKEISPIVKYENNKLSDKKDNPTVIGDVKNLNYNNEYFEIEYFEIKDENNNRITELNVNIKDTEITLKTYYIKIDTIRCENTIGGDKYDDADNNIIRHGTETTITSTITDEVSGIRSISEPTLSFADEKGEFKSVSEANLTPQVYKVNNGDKEISFKSFDELNKELITLEEDKRVKVTKLQFIYTFNTKNSGAYKVSYSATNNSGVTNNNKGTTTFYVDNTAPEITKIEFADCNEGVPKVLHFLTFGLYHDSDIKVIVTAKDQAITSGIDNKDSAATKITYRQNDKDVELTEKNFESKLNEKDNSAERTSEFIIADAKSSDVSSIIKNIAINTSDNAKNAASYKITELKDKIVNRQDITDDFEVVSNSEDTISCENTIGGDKYDDADNNIIRHGTETTITSTVTDELSGIRSISEPTLSFADEKGEFKSVSEANLTPQVYKVNNGDEEISFKSFDELNKELITLEEDKRVKVTKLQFIYTFNTKNSGAYKVSYSATNNSGVTNNNKGTTTFYVDNTAPEITKIEFADCNGMQKLLHFLTFGIYSNDTIKVTVIAKDSAPSSGFDKDGGIEVTNENGKKDKIGEAEIEQRDSSSSEADTTAKYVFTLENAEQAYKLKFRVFDNAENKVEKSLLDLVNDGTIKHPDGKVLNKEFFEAVSTDKGPTAYTDTFKGLKYTDENNSDIIVSGDTVTITSTVTDELSGIRSISEPRLSFADEKGEFKSVSEANLKPQVYKVNNGDKEIPFDSFDKLNKELITLEEDKQVKVTKLQFIYTFNTKNSGAYRVNYSATNNSGVVGENSKDFYVDNTAPEIVSFNFYNIETENLSKEVETTNYGFYFKEDTTVKAEAKDEFGYPCTGVSIIVFCVKGINETKAEEIHCNVDKNDNSASIDIKANFKGNVYAYAIDGADNTSMPYYPNRLVVEDEQMHKSVSSINIDTTEKTSRKDANGLDLFNTDVNVPITVEDSYSGIGMIEYRVKSNYDTGNNYEGKVEVANENQSYDGWNVNKWDENLATSMSTTLKVQNNSNDITIWVRLTDRAGNTSEQEKHISIDKTAPEITISYDNDSHTTRDGTDYFKADRTATITVKERNFNPDDIIYKITNSDGAVPSLSGWADKPDSSDPDNSIHTATVTYSADGDYTFDISYTDMAGNKANNIEQHKFTLDKTLPKISVEFDNNSAHNSSYFKADRTATITIDEHNFSAADVKVAIIATGADNSSSATPPSVSGWSSRGDVRTATVRFDKDGKYAFTVDYTDLADNAAKQAEVTTFYIDKTAPVVEISNIENDSANSGDVAPVVTLSDNNYSGDYKLSLTRVDINAKTSDVSGNFATTVVPNGNTGATVTYNNFDKIEENDGIYVLTADLTDKAGNSANALVTFSVNRFGSTYAYGTDDTKELITNGYTNAEKDIVISEINVDKLTKSSVTLSVDNSELKPLKVNEDYTVKEDTKTGQWHKYDYTIKRANFADEGSYTIEIASTDQAKNSETNRIPIQEDRKLAIQFVVDKTEPVINIAGVENSKLYQESSKDVTVVCEDSNIDASSLEISIDDKVLKEGTDYVLEKDVATLTAKFKVNATNDISAQSIHVSAKDLASNAGNGDVDNFTLSATLLMRFFANTPLVIISALLLAAIAAGVVILIVKRKKGNEE